MSSTKFGLPALNAQVQSKQNCPYHRSASKEATCSGTTQHFYGTGGQTDCTERSCLKIAELTNFARYDLCSVTRSYPHFLARSYSHFLARSYALLGRYTCSVREGVEKSKVNLYWPRYPLSTPNAVSVVRHYSLPGYHASTDCIVW